MKRSLVIFSTLICLLPSLSQAYSREDKKESSKKKESQAIEAPVSDKTIGIGKIRGDGYNFGQNEVSNIHDLVVQECFSAKLRCLERGDLDAIREEQDLAESGMAAPGQDKAVRGRIKLAEILVSCAITGKNAGATNVGVGVGSILTESLGIHGVGVKGDKVTMTCRGYDTSTTEILVSKTSPKITMTVQGGVFSFSGSGTKAVQRALRDFFEELKARL